MSREFPESVRNLNITKFDVEQYIITLYCLFSNSLKIEKKFFVYSGEIFLAIIGPSLGLKKPYRREIFL